MKHLLFLTFFLCVGNFHLLAQNKVNGTVTDKKGKPIPGAKVEIKGSNESTITELDGTFTLDTKVPAKKVKIYYVGMQAKEKKVKPDMLIKLSNSNWWNEKPDKYRWIIGAQMAVPDNNEFKPSFGLMAGRVKNIGWYVKGLYSKPQSTEDNISEYYNNSNYWLTGKKEQSYWSATAGCIIRLWSPIHVYVGAGYSNRKVAWETADGKYHKYEPDSYSGGVYECGLMLKMKRMFINGGIIFSVDDGSNDLTDKGVGNFGIGIYF